MRSDMKSKQLTRIVFALLITATVAAADEPIKIRGYYFTFCRMPTFGLAEWKQIYDRIHSDGGNTVLLWVGGGFRSRKFPVTWQYNQDHKNIQADFVRDLIDYGHSKGIRTLLGFTPFSYDGVNQYPIEHPELKAVQTNGRLAKLSGIHCWGYALNPSRPEAQKFMLDYIREMYLRFLSELRRIDDRIFRLRHLLLLRLQGTLLRARIRVRACDFG